MGELMKKNDYKDSSQEKGEEGLEGLMSRSCGNEKGFALILSLLTMAGMAVLSIGIFTTSSTDMYIARNEREAKMAFYLAEAGIDDALGRFDLGGTSPQFMGESSDGKIERRDLVAPVTRADAAATPNGYPEDGRSFNSDFVNYTTGANLFGSYSVTVSYAEEATDTWTCVVADNCTIGDDDEIVMFGENFGFTGDLVPDEGIHPVFRIDAKGTTDNGTSAEVRVYVTSSILNVLPPGDTILWSEEAIDIQNPKTIDGKVASVSGQVFGCQTGLNCWDVSTTTAATAITDWNDGDMDDYLGLSIAALQPYADVYVAHTGGGTLQLTPGDGTAGSLYGELCSTDTTNNEALHICDAEAKLVIIDNAGFGDAKLNSSNAGRGILVVTGNLELAASVLWEGMIYVMGTVKVTGGVTMFGTIMVDGDDVTGGANEDEDIWVNGNLNIWGSQKVALSAGDMVGIPKFLRWVRL